MKKTVFIALSIAVMATTVLNSCKKGDDTVTFRATITDFNSPNNGSKTHIEVITQEGQDPEYWVCWNNNDPVMINGVEYPVTVSNSNNASIVGVAVNETTGGGYYAFYPAGRATSNGNNVAGWPTQILLPQVQNYTEVGGKQVIEAPMAAYCSNGQATPSLSFKNLCSLLKIEMPSSFDINNNEIAYITVSSSKPLWGVATISGTTNIELSEPNITDHLSATDNTVTLDFTQHGLYGNNGNPSSTDGAAQGKKSRGPFYIVLPPVTDVTGLTIRIYVFQGTSSGNRRTVKMYEKVGNSNSPISIQPNSIYTTGNLPTTSNDVSVVPFPYLSVGEFTVSRTQIGTSSTFLYKKVRFARGNLQYRASTGTWRFAENQWDFVGGNYTGIAGSNTAISSTYNNWIDLFGYGTSGANYQPYSTNQHAIGNINGTNNDWGINLIANGGNQPDKWRTLTKEEFEYILLYRNPNLVHYGATVHNTSGTIILPDNFPLGDSPNWSNLTDAQWAAAEESGAIFLPIGGYRKLNNGTSGLYGTSKEYYWTSTQYWFYVDNNYPYFSSPSNSDELNYGYAVRLARDVD